MFKDLLGGISGAVLGKAAKSIATRLTASAAKPLLTEFLNSRMNAASRQELGRKLVLAGQALIAGKVADASGVLGDVIGDVRF